MSPLLKLQMTTSKQAQARIQSTSNSPGTHSQVVKAYEFAQGSRMVKAERTPAVGPLKRALEGSFTR